MLFDSFIAISVVRYDFLEAVQKQVYNWICVVTV